MIIPGVDPAEQAAFAWESEQTWRCEQCGTRATSRPVGGGRRIAELGHVPGCPEDVEYREAVVYDLDDLPDPAA